MAIKTKKEFVQEVLHEVYGGMPPSDARLSERFVLTKLNDAIASAVMVNAFANTNIEGITYADDVFYVSYVNVTLTNSSNLSIKTGTLPALPVGLPSLRSISLKPYLAESDRQESIIYMIEGYESKRIMSLPKIKKVFAWIEGNSFKVYINRELFPLLELPAVDMKVATADGGLDSAINMPQDMISTAKTKLVGELRMSLGMPLDIKNDGIEIKEAQA